MLIEKTIDGRITPFLIDQLRLASNLSFEKEIRTGHRDNIIIGKLQFMCIFVQISFITEFLDI